MLMEWRIKTLNKKHHFLIKHDTKYSRKRLLLTHFQKTPKFNFHHPHFSKKNLILKEKIMKTINYIIQQMRKKSVRILIRQRSPLMISQFTSSFCKKPYLVHIGLCLRQLVYRKVPSGRRTFFPIGLPAPCRSIINHLIH